MKTQKAQKLSEISRFCTSKPLDKSTWSQYVSTDKARGGDDTLRLTLRLKKAYEQSDPIKVLLSGHSGSGKSTELYRVKSETKDIYCVEIAKIGERYSLPAVDYRQLLFFCASRIIEFASNNQAPITKEESKNLLAWFDEKTIEEVKQEGHKISTEAGAKLGWASFSPLFVKTSGKLSSGGNAREEVSKHIEERLDHLQTNMKIVVDAINRKIAPKKFLLILEDLDKIEDPGQARKIFFEHRLQLLSIPCHTIFTFPIALWYDSQIGTQNYPNRYVLPMVPVSSPPPIQDTTRNQLAEKAKRGRKTLRQVVFYRIDENAHLIDPDALAFLIEKSGGLIRDLLYMLGEAAIGAEINDRDKIEMEDADDATKRLRSEYANRISPRSSGNQNITLEEIESVLGDLGDWPKRTPDHTEAFKMLMQNLCILEYNGERWFDLHPLVKEYLEIRNEERETKKKLQRAKRKKG